MLVVLVLAIFAVPPVAQGIAPRHAIDRLPRLLQRGARSPQIVLGQSNGETLIVDTTP